MWPRVHDPADENRFTSAVSVAIVIAMKTVLSLALVAALTGVSALAAADAIPPDVAACNAKKANDACTTAAMQAGTCVMTKCTVLDYSDGSPPGTKTIDCLQCTPGGSPSDAGSGADCGASTSSKGGCSVSASSLGTWAIAALPFAAITLLRRRKRR